MTINLKLGTSTAFAVQLGYVDGSSAFRQLALSSLAVGTPQPINAASFALVTVSFTSPLAGSPLLVRLKGRAGVAYLQRAFPPSGKPGDHI